VLLVWVVQPGSGCIQNMHPEMRVVHLRRNLPIGRSSGEKSCLLGNSCSNQSNLCKFSISHWPSLLALDWITTQHRGHRGILYFLVFPHPLLAWPISPNLCYVVFVLPGCTSCQFLMHGSLCLARSHTYQNVSKKTCQGLLEEKLQTPSSFPNRAMIQSSRPMTGRHD